MMEMKKVCKNVKSYQLLDEKVKQKLLKERCHSELCNFYINLGFTVKEF